MKCKRAPDKPHLSLNFGKYLIIPKFRWRLLVLIKKRTLCHLLCFCVEKGIPFMIQKSLPKWKKMCWWVGNQSIATPLSVMVEFSASSPDCSIERKVKCDNSKYYIWRQNKHKWPICCNPTIFNLTCCRSTAIKLHSNAWPVSFKRMISNVSCFHLSLEFVQYWCSVVTISPKFTVYA